MFSFRNQNVDLIVRPHPPGLVCIRHSWSQHSSYPTSAALDWLKSSTSEYVTIRNTSSQTHPVTCGVPQGSVLVETLFNLYISGQVVSRFGIFFHCYADTVKEWVEMDNVDSSSTSEPSPAFMSTLTAYLDGKRVWMIQNVLHLNSSKTEAIQILS